MRTDKQLSYCIDTLMDCINIEHHPNDYKEYIDKTPNSRYRIEEIFSRINREYDLSIMVQKVRPTPSNVRIYLSNAFILVKLKDGWSVALEMGYNDMRVKIRIPGFDYINVTMSQLMTVIEDMYVIKYEGWK